jgi:ABC-type transporter lipoprotein component MlaA
MIRRLFLSSALLLLLGLGGCATQANRGDPMESWNRKVFGFNETADAYVLRPMATGYKAVTSGRRPTCTCKGVSGMARWASSASV